MLVSKGAACSAINCSNNRGKNPELSFFTFPKDEERCKQWIRNMRRADFTVKDAKYCRLCSHHFEDNQFVNSNRKRLIWNAVPTLFDIPNAPEKDKDEQDLQEMCGMAYPLRTKRRKIIATESNRTPVDKKSEVKSLPKVPEIKIKQEPVSEDQQKYETKISQEEEPSVPPIKIKEELVTETNNNGEESEVLEPTFVDVPVDALYKEKILEDEMAFDEFPEGMDISSDALKDNSFTGSEDVQDPLESTEGMHEEQTTSVTNNSCSALDDMPLLKRRPVVPVKVKSPPASSRGEVIVNKKLPTFAVNRKIFPLPRLSKFEPNASASKTIAIPPENSDEWHVLQRLSWVREQKDKVEEHIRAVRQEKLLKERMEECHSAFCLCVKCENIKRNSFQKPASHITTARLCSQCNKVFKNETNYLKHKVNCGTPQTAAGDVKADVPYVCSSCGEVFDNSSKQLKHMAVCSPKVTTAVAFASVNTSVDSKNSCGLCGEKFQDEASQLKHLKNCFSNKPYECYSCGRNFHDPEMRAIHVRRMHEKERVCFQCGMKYQTVKDLEKHVKLQCCRKIITFPCLYCNRRFYNEKSRNDHTGSHLKKKFFSCTFCVEKFYYQSELIRHIGVHKEEKEKSVSNSSTSQKSLALDAYECSLCGERFDTETLKVKHILNCFRRKQYLCLVCGKHFEDRESRATHVVMDHKDVSEDVCLQCGLKCVSVEILNQHQKFQCNMEGDSKDFTSPMEEEEEQKYDRTSPVKETEEQKYDRTSPIKEEVEQKYDRTTPIKEEEEQKYVCPVCRKEFPTETELDDHTAIHVEEAMYIIPDDDVQQPPATENEDVEVASAIYQCTPCGMFFISHQELSLHSQNKHNKYLCFYPTCGMTFNSVDSGVQHFNAVHNAKPLNKTSELEESQSEIQIAKVEGNVQYPVGLETDSNPNNNVAYRVRRGRPAKKGITLVSVAKLASNKLVVNPKTETTLQNAAQGTSGLIYKVRSGKPIILRRKRVVRNDDEKPLKPIKPLTDKMVVAASPPHPCDVCGKKFFLLTDRAKHILTHVGEKKFSCSTCGKMFTLRENLERHLTTHMTSDSDSEESPPYLCQICGKCFLTLPSRAEHMRQHPCMNCSFCGKHFPTKRNLMDHLVGVHSGQMPQNNQLNTSSLMLKKSIPSVKTYMYSRGKRQS